MTTQISMQPWEIEKKFLVLNLRNLDDDLLHQNQVDILLGTKGFDTEHTIKSGEYLIEAPKNVVFVKIPTRK